MIRRFGDPAVAGVRYKHRPGAYVILPLEGKVLLTLQAAPYVEFQLPGGGVEKGEHPIPALHREVIEETGWIMGPPRKIGMFRRFTFMPEYNIQAEKMCSVYVARPIRKLCEPLEPDHTAHFVDFDVALDLLSNEGDAFFFEQYLRSL